MKMSSKKAVPAFTTDFPPVEFSNAMSRIYGEWDFSNWRKSNEWKLFNAGKSASMTKLSRIAKAFDEEFENQIEGKS